jgi:hypothetical protein
MKIFKFLGVFIAISILSLHVGIQHANASTEGNWDFSIEPFLWAVSIDGDAGVGRVTGADIDIDFDDILDNLESTFSIAFEAHHTSGWGVLLEYGFFDLSADKTGPLGGVIEADFRQGIMGLAAAKRFDLANGYYEITGGIRWWDNDIDVEVDPLVLPGTVTASVDEDWVDPVVGMRFFTPMSEKWKLALRGDVGGFGAGSDFTAAADAGVFYSFSETVSLDVKYRAIWVDYEDGTKGTPGYFAYDTVTHGPFLGLKVDF